MRATTGNRPRQGTSATSAEELVSRGTIYRESEQEGFGSRTTVKVRGFEF
jgi:hypothetical protein